jgi:hypothetical protein
VENRLWIGVEPMPYIEIPSDAEVVAALGELGGHATALDLCNKLVHAGHSRRDSQLAIQRASERGRIKVKSDWTLSVIGEPVNGEAS